MDLQHEVSICFLGFLLLLIFFIRPSNTWHTLAISNLKLSHYLILALTVLSIVLITVLPMSLSPYWNGTDHELADKQQYDRMGDALLQGHLYIDNGNIDPALQAMKNPYDKAERERLGVKFHWDEAYYNNHYYMYFGVVPTILLFIPFKLITHNALLSYQATQIFTVLAIIGLFYLFYILSITFFPQFPFSLYLLLSSAFSVLSIGYSIAAPALYCTAIVSGICLMIWSIICFWKSLLPDVDENKRNMYLFLGAVFGALAFGCRPPIALANILVIVVIHKILESNKYEKKAKTKKISLLLTPYFVIGILLMLYNYARFDNVFEFGQSYQLTLADQHNYRSFFERFNLREIVIGFLLNLYAPCGLSESFPYLRFNGFFINYPVLLLSFKLFAKPVTSRLKELELHSFAKVAFLISFVIILFDVYWSPFLSKRYHLDFLYLLSIVTFLAITTWLETVTLNKRKVLLFCITVLSFYVFVVEFLFFCIPFDGNYVMYYPERLIEIYKGLRLGL